MKAEKNFIDYGIYIDRKHAYIVMLNHVIHEALIKEEVVDNTGVLPRSTKINLQQIHLQNDRNEQLKKFCKLVMDKLENAHSLLIFGPSVTKFELQKEIRNSRMLKHVTEKLLVTDTMNKEAAIRFAQDNYKTITVGQQTFTAAKMR